MTQGPAKDEVNNQERNEIIKSPEAVQSWYWGPQDDSGSVLGCYRKLWFHFYSPNGKKTEEIQNEVVSRRSCKHFINYEPSRTPVEHISIQEKARDRNDTVKNIFIGAAAVAASTAIIELIIRLVTKK